MRRIVHLFLVLVLNFLSFGQVIEVIDKASGEPVSDVILEIKSLSTKDRVIVEQSENKSFLLEPYLSLKGPYTITFIGSNFKPFNDSVSTFSDKTYFIQLDPTITALDEFIVTAQYTKVKVDDAVHNVKIIGEEKIQAMGAQNLRDVLTNELNVRLSQDFALGSSMNLLGISGQNVKILVDGIPLTGRLNGNIDISQINLNNVERIEIIEGPLSVSYGTDALAGTINIITKKGNERDLEIKSRNYYESNGIYNTTARVGLGRKNNQISLDLGRNYFDGWNPEDPAFFYNSEPIADQTRFQQWKPKEQYFGTFNYRRNLRKQQFDLTSDLFHEEVINRGLPRPPYYINAFDDYYRTRRFNNSAAAKGPLNKKLNYTAFVAYNHFQRRKNTFFRDLTTIEDQLTQNSGDQDTSTFNNFLSRGSISKFDKNSKINYEVGYDINVEAGLGRRILDDRQVIGDLAVYSTAEIKVLQKLIVRPGLRVIHNTAYRAPLVPSANIKYTLHENKLKSRFIDLRASYARGFRAPDLKELYFFFVDINHNIQGNPNLKAENSHNYMMALTYRMRIKDAPLRVHVQGFYNDIENMISLAQSDGTLFSYFNIDRFRTTGAQLTANLVIHQFQINAGTSYIGRYNRFNANPATSDKFLFSPEAQLNLQYTMKKLKWSFNTFYKYTGELPIVRVMPDGNPGVSVVDAFNTLDVATTKSFMDDKLILNAGIKNIFNITNINGFMPGGAHSGGSNSMAIGMGRTYFMTLTLQLTKTIKKHEKN